tara:strand:- start:379 stop:555 length:177 start_codon:yes stop_codon:yes gene_type:complete
MNNGLNDHLWNLLEQARDERDEALARMINAEEELKKAKEQAAKAVKLLVGLDITDKPL